MDGSRAVIALGALAHEHRLAVYRLLMERGPDGLAAGLIAEQVGIPASSLTFHLQHLLRAGLASQRRVGRQIIYAADLLMRARTMAELFRAVKGPGGTPGQ